MAVPTKVLVTGGAGYVGSHCCKALAQAGFLPITLDNLVHGHREAVKWGPFVEGDLADLELLTATIQSHDVDAVLHFAAFAYVGESMRMPGKYFANNVANTLNLLEAMRLTSVPSIVFSSTCATYGLPTRLPITEAQLQKPVNPYGESKLFVERMLDWYELAHGVRSACLRYFNAAGADPDGEIGESHDPETHLIPIAIATALGQHPTVDIFGTDYPTADGTAVRDYIHVSDLAEAHVAALRRLLLGSRGLRLNLGTGRGYSVREVVDAVGACFGRSIPTRNCPRRPGDVPTLVADASLAYRTLEWKPRLSSLEEIVGTARRWHERRNVVPLRAAATSPLSDRAGVEP